MYINGVSYSGDILIDAHYACYTKTKHMFVRVKLKKKKKTTVTIL